MWITFPRVVWQLCSRIDYSVLCWWWCPIHFTSTPLTHTLAYFIAWLSWLIWESHNSGVEILIFHSSRDFGGSSATETCILPSIVVTYVVRSIGSWETFARDCITRTVCLRNFWRLLEKMQIQTHCWNQIQYAKAFHLLGLLALCHHFGIIKCTVMKY